MIPKVIHYCWFGRNPKPKLFEKCLKSWKKYCPDYEIVEWNEDNFEINSNLYTKEAYECKKWAFVTDYVRLYVLYNFGGIYMDTDVEVLKPLDRFLNHEAFSGFENETSIPTGIMASEKGNDLFKHLLDYYTDRHFIVDGKMDVTTNVVTITKLLSQMGFCPNNQYQVIHGFALYPYDYFCPQDFATGSLTVTENSYTIHHFAGSWLSNDERKHVKHVRVKAKISKVFGEKMANRYDNLYYANRKEGYKGIYKFLLNSIKRKIKPLKKS